jgi:hypothetical protein
MSDEFRQWPTYVVEDDDGGSIEEMAKIRKSFEIPKGTARIAFAIALERHDKAKGKPKKTLNKLAYRYIEIMLDPKTDPKLFVECWKDVQDRFDGKAAQAVALTDKDGGALIVQVMKLTQNADNPASK